MARGVRHSPRGRQRGLLQVNPPLRMALAVPTLRPPAQRNPGADAPLCPRCDDVVRGGLFCEHVVVNVLFNEWGMLLTMRSSGNWEHHGGKVEVGESYAEAAAREMDEEVGLRVPLLEVGSWQTVAEQAHVLRVFHLFVGVVYEQAPVLRERQRGSVLSVQAGWVR